MYLCVCLAFVVVVVVAVFCSCRLSLLLYSVCADTDHNGHVGTAHYSIFVLMTIAMTAQSTNHIAPQVVYQKLEHALITDGKLRPT